MKQAYEKYLKYLDSRTIPISRMPFMVVDDNPPDTNYQYFRKLTLKEFSNRPDINRQFL